MIFKLSTAFVFLAALARVKAAPTLISRHEGHDDSTSAGTSTSDIAQNNALEAQQQNARFATLKETDSCQAGEMACIDGAFAMCTSGKWTLQKCATGLRCYAEPHDGKEGTALVCDTDERADLVFKNAGATGGTKGADAADDGEGDEGDDDIPDCEEGDEDEGDDIPEDTTSVAARDEPRFIYRRQEASTIVPDLPPTAVPGGTIPRSSTLTAISSTPTLISTSTNAVVTPTVVIGTDNIVTVTVVSTTTVSASATECAPASSSSSALPRATVASSSSATPRTVVAATPTVSSSSTSVSTSSVLISTTTSPAISTTTSSTIAATTSASAVTVISLTASSTSTSLPTSASGGLNFSVGTTVATASA